MASVKECNPFQTYLESIQTTFSIDSSATASLEPQGEDLNVKSSMDQVVERIKELVDVNGLDLFIKGSHSPISELTQTPFQFIAEKFPTPILKGVIDFLKECGVHHRAARKVLTPLAHVNFACNVPTRPDGNQAIHYAAKAGNIRNVVLLAQHNPQNLNGKNDREETPLHLAPDRVALEQELASRKTEPMQDTEGVKIVDLTQNPDESIEATYLNDCVIQSGGIESFLSSLSTSFAELRS